MIALIAVAYTENILFGIDRYRAGIGVFIFFTYKYLHGFEVCDLFAMV